MPKSKTRGAKLQELSQPEARNRKENAKTFRRARPIGEPKGQKKQRLRKKYKKK